MDATVAGRPTGCRRRCGTRPAGCPRRGFGVVRNVKYNWAAIIAVLIGILFGYYVHVTYPTFLFGAAGIAASFIVYTLLAMAAATSLGAELSTASSGAEPAA